MEFYNQGKLNISNLSYKEFLNKIKERINTKEFQDALEKVKEIDKNHYTENITCEELENIVQKYLEKEVSVVDKLEKIQIILPGNPEIIFKLGLEAVRQNVRMAIKIDNFCLAQNTFLVDFINIVAKEMNLDKLLLLENLVKEEEIEKVSNKYDMTICLGNSNDFNRLKKKYRISNLKLYPIYIFEIYSDSLELEEVRKGLFDYVSRNRFEIEIYDIELEIEEVVNEINRDGYGFCAVLLSKDKDKIKMFKENVKSKYVFVNENPFNKIEFEFNLREI